MNINFDDPKWTAFVLGELDESERAAMERLLETSEEARAYIEELRIAATSLKEELTPQFVAALAPEQRAAVEAAAEMTPAPGNLRWFRIPPVWIGGLAVAAMILIAVAMPSLWHAPTSVIKEDAVPSASAPREENTNPAAPEIRQQAAPAQAAVAENRTPEPAPANELLSKSSVQGNVAANRPAADTVAAPSASTQAPAARTAAEVTQPAPLRPAAPPAPQLQVNAVTTGSASISGYVSDTSNALIPGVTVTATNLSTGVVTTVLTNDAGGYRFVALPPGTYKLEARLSGFQVASIPNINLGASDSLRFNIAMVIGNGPGTSVAVAVNSPNKLAESSASVGQVLPAGQIRDLPVSSGNVLELITVLPDARTDAAKSAVSQNASVRDGLSAEQQGQGQGQGQSPQVQLSQAGAGGGRGGGRGGAGGGGARGGGAAAPAGGAPAGVAGGVVSGTGTGGGIGFGQGNGVGVAAGAPPPPPPPPPSAVRPPARLPDNRTVLNNGDYDRRNTVVGNESYAAIADNPFIRVRQEPLSTFSSDVDTASYANVRRYLNQGQLPPRDAVRIEEMINYFKYDYPQPSGRDPIGAQMEVASAPWNPAHRLVRIGIKARDIDTRRKPATNLVFLIDVSGSMQPQERLPLIKSGLKMLVDNLTENDHVSIVVYAGDSGIRLPSTSGDRKDIINRALDGLEAGGSTNGSSGIQLAYQIATANFIPGGVNRVILATDGDFNLGIVNQNDLVRLIQDRARTGVFLSVLGVGMGNLKDATMEKLADSGNGNYSYIDSLNEAHKVLVEQMGATLVTVAKDVKLQVEFNPAVVEAYRLIGYENRLLAAADFNNDRKDAGDMGAGHTVTALYEIVPRGGNVPGPDIDPLKYQEQARTAAPAPQPRNTSNETLTLKIRYKDPDGSESKLLSLPLVDRETQFSRASQDFRFAAAVAEFGMILRSSPYRGNASVSDVLDTAQGSRGPDRNGYRQEFIGLVQRARAIRGLN